MARWMQLEHIEQWANEGLMARDMDDIHRISLAVRHGLDLSTLAITDALVAVCGLNTPLSVNEAKQIGPEMTALISNVRQCVIRERMHRSSNFTTKSHLQTEILGLVNSRIIAKNEELGDEDRKKLGNSPALCGGCSWD